LIYSIIQCRFPGHIARQPVLPWQQYHRLLGAIFKAVSVSIPRLDEKCQTLLEHYEATGDPDITEWRQFCHRKITGEVTRVLSHSLY